MKKLLRITSVAENANYQPRRVIKTAHKCNIFLILAGVQESGSIAETVDVDLIPPLPPTAPPPPPPPPPPTPPPAPPISFCCLKTRETTRIETMRKTVLRTSSKITGTTNK